jgi:hypothetical protein
VYGQTAYNRTVTASPPSAARATKNRSRATPFVRFFSATFFCARKNAPHFSSSGAKKRQLQPERYAPLFPNVLKTLLTKIIKNIKILVN